MARTGRALFLVAATAGGVAASRALARRAAAPGSPRRRWHTVTVYRPIGEVAPGGVFPEPIGSLAGVEVRVTEAPGDRGTEIAARLLGGEPSGAAALKARITGDDPRYAVRRALRETRSLLETGDVLLPDSPPTTKKTVLNRPLQHATDHGREEGLL